MHSHHWLWRPFFRLHLVPDYWKALFTQLQNIIAGVSVPTVAILLWMWLGNPPTWAKSAYLIVAGFLAGYYVWYADHIRLTPKFCVARIQQVRSRAINQLTGHYAEDRMYVQLLPQCLTDADVEECVGHMKLEKWSEAEKKWETSELNESMRLEWSNGIAENNAPIKLESGNERHLNLFFMGSIKNRIVPTVIPFPVRAEDIFEKDDRFRFDITIRGKHCKPVKVLVEVKRGSTWEHPEFKMIHAAGSDILAVNSLYSSTGV